jgi:hypothetical protein
LVSGPTGGGRFDFSMTDLSLVRQTQISDDNKQVDGYFAERLAYRAVLGTVAQIAEPLFRQRTGQLTFKRMRTFEELMEHDRASSARTGTAPPM